MKITLILLQLFLSLNSWKTTGHFIVARIAEKQLKNHKILYQDLIDILDIFKGRTKERKHPFVECASFVDDIKAINQKEYNWWHYYN